jgi:hypothetical protein
MFSVLAAETSFFTLIVLETAAILIIFVVAADLTIFFLMVLYFAGILTKHIISPVAPSSFCAGFTPFFHTVFSF